MDRNELEKYNVGENLDALMTLDPRGYGVCRILYAGSRAHTGAPLTMAAAEALCPQVRRLVVDVPGVGEFYAALPGPGAGIQCQAHHHLSGGQPGGH